MNTEDWEKVNDIVIDALDIEPSRRAAFLDERCNGLAEIRREAESLLAGDAGAAKFLDSPAIVNYASFFEKDEEPEALVGQKIGNYRIIRELGFGGMGAVFLAERNDGKFEQQVALKLLKREMNTSALRKHFQQERSILAALQHPNIARLLDAGATRDKIPFLVMEYVEGLPIDEYCSMNDLSLGERLDLFRDICSAVDFAHRNLIIHRDLKPSNILVTNDGVPKLLDFGISKILSADLENADSKTITRMGVMTPSYASPEQLKNESVTTATDVYSLGVILYELLAGRRPFEISENNMTEIYRAVIEREPPLPSSVVIDLSPPAAGQANENNNGAQNTRFNKTRQTIPQIRAIKAQYLRGDLDNIVLKALKKEPERRYSSVEKFSDDVHRYLKGLPVAARPDTFTYRAQKFINRNRSVVITASLVLVALVGGLVTTLWQSRVAQAESNRARLAAAKAEKINAYLQNVLNFSNPHWLSSNPKRNREATVAQAMDEALNNIDTELAGEPEIQAEILFTLTQSYSSQGDFAKAESLARSAIEKFNESLGENNVKSKQTGIILGDILYLTGKFDEAEQHYIAGIDYFRPMLAHDRSQIKWLAIALNDLGNVHIMKGRFREADTVIAEAAELSLEITGRDRYVVPIALGNRAASLQYLNDFQGSLDASLKALEEMRKLGSNERFEAGVAMISTARAYTLMNNYAKADEYHREANRILVGTVGEDNIYALSNRYHTANNYFKQGRVAEAKALAEKTLENQKRVFPNGHFTIAFSKRLLGDIYTQAGELKKAEQELREALEFLAKSMKEPNHEISFVKTSLGENLIAQKRMAEAQEILASALDGYLKTRGDNNIYTDRCRAALNSIPKI